MSDKVDNLIHAAKNLLALLSTSPGYSDLPEVEDAKWNVEEALQELDEAASLADPDYWNLEDEQTETDSH
jgi:hypothetical protein